MAVTVTLDNTDGSSVTNHAGTITELIRTATVSGLTGGTGTLLSVFQSTGFPKIGDEHPDNDELGVVSEYPISLFLEEISIDPNNSSPLSTKVNLVYRHQSSTMELLSASAGLESVVTNKYPDTHEAVGTTDNGIAEGPGQQIILGPHPLFSPSALTGQDGNSLRVQTGEVTIPIVRESVTCMNVLGGGSPDALYAHAANWTNIINKEMFLFSGDQRKWKISAVAVEPVKRDTMPASWSYRPIRSVRRMRFIYDIQFKQEGWNPITVIGTDPSTGVPVGNLQNYPNAQRKLNYYKARSYKDLALVTSIEKWNEFFGVTQGAEE